MILGNAFSRVQHREPGVQQNGNRLKCFVSFIKGENIMLRSAIFIVSWLVVSLLCACMTSKKDLALESNVQHLEQQNKKIEAMECKLEDMENTNLNLASKVKRLEFEIKKRDAIIQIQGKAVKLFDDPKRTIENSLKDQIEAKLLEIQTSEGMKRLIYPYKDIFSSGGLKISKRGKEILLKLARSVKPNKKQYIIVEGHTDNRSVAASAKRKFPTNWEISAERATVVVRFFQEEAGLEPERLSAVGYSFYRPITSNDTEEGRSINRRVEIILGPPI
ncbi:MAG: OmpA family protein [Deltaproteobacteria bacterium]|nr:OmpA family protein [Deltaproteobacteria bacterium]